MCKQDITPALSSPSVYIALGSRGQLQLLLKSLTLTKVPSFVLPTGQVQELSICIANRSLSEHVEISPFGSAFAQAQV